MIFLWHIILFITSATGLANQTLALMIIDVTDDNCIIRARFVVKVIASSYKEASGECRHLENNYTYSMGSFANVRLNGKQLKKLQYMAEYYNLIIIIHLPAWVSVVCIFAPLYTFIPTTFVCCIIENEADTVHGSIKQ